jgi:GntR family transcriptional regulator, rspAB operon transcriptional repressor
MIETMKPSAGVTSTLVPLKRRSLAQDAIARIRRAIVAAEIPEGSPLLEDQLAAQLGVSRVPIREALTQLELEGLVEGDSRGRNRVRNFTELDFQDCFEVRCALELMSARLAVKRMTRDDMADLETIIARQEKSTDLTELSLHDVDLHERIIQATRNRQLMVCWKTIRSQIEFWLARSHRVQATLKLSSVDLTVPGHRNLLGALRSGDERKAEEAMQQEMITWREWLHATDNKTSRQGNSQ